ncbi:MAG TPA: hypothetical protein VIV11_27630 [Kofleriaceae bacterium]
MTRELSLAAAAWPIACTSALACALAACSPPSSAIELDADTTTPPDAAPIVDDSPLHVRSLGVQGFLLQRGDDVVMTAPLFTRQSVIQVSFGVPLVADTAAIDVGLAGDPLGQLSAIVSGHAHYDHFMDVPYILAQAPHAHAYTNLTGRHMLAALAPDRPACANPTPAQTLARDRVVAVDDPLASYVDYTNCAAQKPPGAPLAGSWLYVPNSNVRLMAFCSVHPDQVGPIHFGEGSIDEDQCELPRAASGWLEGQTLAFVIDFLDESREPAFRVFYQDAPTNPPIGNVPSAVLGDKQVDLALLCVGSADAVDDHPTTILANLQPRYAVSGHWEDFFQPINATPQPIPLLDLDGYMQRAEAALPGKHTLAQPGARFVVPLEP